MMKKTARHGPDESDEPRRPHEASASGRPTPVGPSGAPRAIPPLPGGVDRLDGDVFHVPVGPAGGFEAIVAALSRKLAPTAVPTHIGMVALYPFEHHGRFTQCLVDVEKGAWAECVSNRYLEPDDRLTEADQRLLVDLGFEAPADLHPNFWLIQKPPVDWRRIAELLVARSAPSGFAVRTRSWSFWSTPPSRTSTPSPSMRTARSIRRISASSDSE